MKDILSGTNRRAVVVQITEIFSVGGGSLVMMHSATNSAECRAVCLQVAQDY